MLYFNDEIVLFFSCYKNIHQLNYVTFQKFLKINAEIMKINNLKLDHSCYSYKNIWTDFDGLKFTFLIKSRKPSSFRNDKLISQFDDFQH